MLSKELRRGLDSQLEKLQLTNTQSKKTQKELKSAPLVLLFLFKINNEAEVVLKTLSNRCSIPFSFQTMLNHSRPSKTKGHSVLNDIWSWKNVPWSANCKPGVCCASRFRSRLGDDPRQPNDGLVNPDWRAEEPANIIKHHLPAHSGSAQKPPLHCVMRRRSEEIATSKGSLKAVAHADPPTCQAGIKRCPIIISLFPK